MRFDSDGPCQWSIEATVHAGRPYQGVLRLLELRPGALPELPDWLPADASMVGRWRWDFPLAMKAFGNLYDQANEPGPNGEGLYEDLLDGLRDDPEGVHIDLRRELFEQLGPEMWRVSDAGGPHTAEEAAPSESAAAQGMAVRRQGARRADRGRALARFYKGDDRVRRPGVRRFDVWTVGENASLFAARARAIRWLRCAGLALGNGQLLFSTDVDLLRAAISPQGDAPQVARRCGVGLAVGMDQGPRNECHGVRVTSAHRRRRGTVVSVRHGGTAPKTTGIRRAGPTRAVRAIGG